MPNRTGTRAIVGGDSNIIRGFEPPIRRALVANAPANQARQMQDYLPRFYELMNQTK